MKAWAEARTESRTIPPWRGERRAGSCASLALAGSLALASIAGVAGADDPVIADKMAGAASAREEEATDASAALVWSAGLYAEGDSEGGLGGVADLAWFVGERNQLYLGASYADTTRNLSGLSTRGFTLGGAHDFGAVGLDAWYDAWTDPDAVTARSVNAAIDVGAGGWTFTFTGQLRRSDFETFAADAEVTLRTGAQVHVVAAADCDLDNSGIGLRLGYDAGRWRVDARGMTYSYAEAECDFSSPALDYLRRTRPAVFRQFARQVTAPLSTSAMTWIGAENALLDRSWGGGVAFDAGRVEYAFNYLALVEHFDGLESDSVSASATVEVGRSLQVLLTGGYSEGDRLDPAWLGGLGLRWEF